METYAGKYAIEKCVEQEKRSGEATVLKCYRGCVHLTQVFEDALRWVKPFRLLQ